MKNKFIEIVNHAHIVKLRFQTPEFEANEICIEQVQIDQFDTDKIKCYTSDGGIITFHPKAEDYQSSQHGQWTKFTFGQLQLLIA